MKKKSDCESCDDLTARLDRLERRLDKQEDLTAHWHKRWKIVDEKLANANGKISLLERDNQGLKKTIEKKDAVIHKLQKKLFAPSTEIAASMAPPEDSPEEAPPKKPRGKQIGSKGFGRKTRHELPVEEKVHDVSEHDKSCGTCGKAREQVPFSEESEEIHYSYKVVRIRHKRLKYKRTCRCDVPAIVTAKGPDKLIPKGLFSTEFWAHVLLEKFWLQRPISRICMSLALQGLTVSEGTIASGLKRLTKLFAPLYKAIRTQSRTATHWHMDETHWRVFTDVMGKENHQWWLWVAETKDTTLFILDPSRSAKVPKEHLAGVETGILSCDRYSAYKPLQEQGILLSYCWSHVRRDFIALKDFPKLRTFAKTWISRIDSLFHYNKQRASSEFAERELFNICKQMEKESRRLLSRKDTHDEARRVLSSLRKHWDGLTLFLDHPAVPMDNNAAERAIRNPVVGRKCYYGSRSIWSGFLSAMLFSIFGTLAKNKIDPRRFIVNYLNACARNKGKPPDDISDFLPWIQKSLEPKLLTTMVH